MICLDFQYPTIEISAAAELWPIDHDDAKKYCDYEGDDRDQQFDDWIKSATEQVERDCELALCTQTGKLYLPYFPIDEIRINRSPISAITSITYLDTDNVSQTLASTVYQTNLKRTPPRILLDYQQTWPTVRYDTENAVTVTMTMGYGEPKDVPARAREAIRVLVKRSFDGCDGDAMDSPVYAGLISGLRWRPYL